MRKHLIAMAALLVLAPASSAFAQRVETAVLFGWTLSDGVTSDGVLAPDGNIYDAVDVKDSFSWGFDIGVNATDNIQVGFLFGQQLSTLGIEGTAKRELGDLKVNTYHPYVAFNAGAPDARVRPFLLVGFGATNYGGVDFTRADGTAASTGSETQFSTTWGAGVKVYGSSNVGFRAGLQWTPTYIKTDSEGWWCDPYWGCYVVGDAQYANQFQFNGGVTIRF
jgi:Outer membrane protein beta-barrel domain